MQLDLEIDDVTIKLVPKGDMMRLTIDYPRNAVYRDTILTAFGDLLKPRSAVPALQASAALLTPRQERAEAARAERLGETILQHVAEVGQTDNPIEAYSRASAEQEVTEAIEGNDAPYLPMECNQCTKVLTAEQQRKSLVDFGILLCPAHQREARSQVNATG